MEPKKSEGELLREDLIKRGFIKPDGKWEPKKPLNKYQMLALTDPQFQEGLRTPIPQSGSLALPTLVVQWANDWKRRYSNIK